ncbi:hypothetical protein MKX01_006416 [Papaver californicum]|nr:hypothetical protein MKX01_006416 [Papaver californicum]
MGGQLSKRPGESPPVEYKAGLSSYEAACRLDPDLQSFDETLQHRTSQVINTLATGVEVRALSLDSLKKVTGCLLEMNEEIVKIILDCKQDIWKNQQLFELVEEYFENSLQTLDLCTALEKCLKKARDSQLLIHVALQQFEEEDGGLEKKINYKHQIVMLDKLQAQKIKLDNDLLMTVGMIKQDIFAATVVLQRIIKQPNNFISILV